jgi:hypothetical protein
VAVSFIGGGNRRIAASHWQTLSHNVVSNTPCHEWDSNLQVVVIGTDCIVSCKSNYQMITTMMVPDLIRKVAFGGSSLIRGGLLYLIEITTCTSFIYFRCLKLLKAEFKRDLSLKHGLKALKYLSNDWKNTWTGKSAQNVIRNRWTKETNLMIHIE